MREFFDQFLHNLSATTPLEYIAVISGIASVWFSRLENILVYPVGLVSTIIYVFLSLNGDLYGEASVNLYYTIVSIWGWYLWTRRNEKKQHVLHVTQSTSREWRGQVLFFAVFYVAIYAALIY